MLLALFEGTPPMAGRFPSQRASNTDFFEPQFNKQLNIWKLAVIWHTMALIRLQCNASAWKEILCSF